MDLLVKVAGSTPEWYSLHRLRKDNPQVSFPKEIPDAILSKHGIYRVTDKARPKGKNYARDELPKLVSGKWVWGWSVKEKTPEEIKKEARKSYSTSRGQARGNLDELDIEAIQVLLKEVSNGGTTPKCNQVAKKLNMPREEFISAIQDKVTSYENSLITAWGNKLQKQGGLEA